MTTATTQTVRAAELTKEVVTSLVYRLGIDTGRKGSYDSDPAPKAVIDVLLGRSERATAAVDASYQGAVWLALGSITEQGEVPDYRVPLVVRASTHLTPEVKEKLRNEKLPTDRMATTEEVANYFLGRAAHLGDDCQEFPATYAPMAAESFAFVTMGGDVPELLCSSEDTEWSSNDYSWCDLREVPVGGSVYRLSCTKTLWLFLRQEDGWKVIVTPNAEWARTTYNDGEHNFGALLNGALGVLRRVVQ